MKNHVISLISKLSKREKFYFTKLYEDSRTKNFYTLYLYISETKNCNIHKIKEHFKGTSIERNLSSELNLLNKRILRCLNIYHINLEDDNFNLLQSLQNARILIEKGEQKQARKILLKAKGKAIEKEQFSTLVSILSLQESLDIDTLDGTNLVQQSTNLAKLREECVKKIQNFLEYKSLRLQLIDLQFTTNFHVSNPQDYKHIFESPLLENEEMALSTIAKEKYFFCKESSHSLMGNFSECLFYSKKRIDLLEENSHLFDKLTLAKALNNYVLALLDNKDFKQAAACIEKISNLVPMKDSEKFIPYFVNYLTLKLYLQSDKIDLLKSFLGKSYKDLVDRLGILSSIQIDEWLQHLMLGHIRTDNYSAALDIYNVWHTIGIKDYSFLKSKLMRCICLYEQENTKLLESEVENLYKTFSKSKKPNPLFKSFYKFFKADLKKDKCPYELFYKLNESIQKIKDYKEQFVNLEETDVLHWLRKKERKIPAKYKQIS